MGGGGWILHFTKIVSVLTDGDNYILKLVLSIFLINTIDLSMKPKKRRERSFFSSRR